MFMSESIYPSDRAWLLLVDTNDSLSAAFED
jgi:hypothetical protein